MVHDVFGCFAPVTVYGLWVMGASHRLLVTVYGLLPGGLRCSSATPAASGTERWYPGCRGLASPSRWEGLGVGFPPPYGGGEGGGALQTTLKSHAAEDGSQDSNDKLENGLPLIFRDFE